ncbi:MAG TPA: hypothetical protein DD423_05035 [Opitutae bacterium]|nr:hypothetical protein [Opitutae bacterium]
MKFKTLVAGVACFSAIFATALQAQAPQMFRYQGRLLDNDTLVSGDLNFNFKLYSAPTGGAALYEDAATVTVVDGLYSTMIGDDTTSGGDLGDALKNSAVYLEITVGGETLAPRERIVSVPYAMNDNGLPSGTVVLSATNPNPALEAQGYSLVYSDVTSPADWAVALQKPLSPLTVYNHHETVLFGFGDYIAMEGYSSSGGTPPFFYSRGGFGWSQSTPPFNYSSMYSDRSVTMADRLYVLNVDGSNLRVAVTANGADWEELTVSVPVVLESMELKLEVFAKQLWLFGVTNTGEGYEPVLLKSSDGAGWTLVDSPAWDTMELETQSTPERLLVFANESGGPHSEKYVWSTTDGVSWTRSNAMIPVRIEGVAASTSVHNQFAFANGALWVIGVPEGETVSSLYQSSDWGNSWQEVSTNLPEFGNLYNPNLEDLGAAPGLLFSDKGSTQNGFIYITENGSEWTKVADEPFDRVSNSGQIWLFNEGETSGFAPPELYSIGGPLRNGRFFYYQKD